jgi:hypothetical protein
LLSSLATEDFMKPFANSISARILGATTSFALLTAGAVAAIGGEAKFGVLAVMTMLCVAGCIIAVGLALEEHLEVAMGLALALPLVGGTFLAGLFTVAGKGHGFALSFIAAAAAVAAYTASLATTSAGAAGSSSRANDGAHPMAHATDR